MITKQVKFYVTKKGQILKSLVLVQDGKVTHYANWNEDENKFQDIFWKQSAENLKEFNTESKASQYLERTKPTQEEIDKVMAYFVSDEKTFQEAVEKHFGKHQYDLPAFIHDKFKDIDEDDTVPNGGFLDAIHQYIQEGVLNIDGCSFHKSRVSLVKWGPNNETDYERFGDEKQESPIMLILDDKKELYPRTAEERWFVKLVFGANQISNRVWNNIEIPK